MVDCIDASDEVGCERNNNEFRCGCITRETCSTIEGCKSKAKLIDGFLHCPYEKILFRNKTRIKLRL